MHFQIKTILIILVIQDAKKVTIDQDLNNILSEAPGKCVQYAVIEGVLKFAEHDQNGYSSN